VNWLISRWRRGGASRARLVCYLRENGPIAYALDVFGHDPRERAGAMLAADLAWYWKALGRGGAARDWTRLTAWSLAALLADMNGGQEGVTPPLVLIGIDALDAPTQIGDAEIAGWMKSFSAGADLPLHAVVSRPAPGGDLLFVAQHPPESVRTLLQAWGIDRDKAERRAYPHLQNHALEEIIRSLR
jgi:hypothetical protein